MTHLVPTPPPPPPSFPSPPLLPSRELQPPLLLQAEMHAQAILSTRIGILVYGSPALTKVAEDMACR